MLYSISDLEKNIKKLKVAVIGDFCLDQYWYMDSKFDKKHDYNSDISFALTNIEYYPGGAGNVANNFVKLGVDVKCVGIIGDDGAGYQLMKCLSGVNVDVENMIKTQEKETHTCIRPIRITENHKVALNEIITMKFSDTSPEVESKVKDILEGIIDEVDAFVLVEQFDDNNKGIFTDNIRKVIINLAKNHKDKIFIVDSRKYINKYDGMYLKCNQSEFAETIQRLCIKESFMTEINYHLKDFKALFVTRGEDGVKVIENNRCTYNIPAIEVNQEVNTCGAGDSATVGITVGLFSNYDTKKAAMLGNIIASITIRDLGSTGYATYKNLVDTLKLYDFAEA